MSEMLPHEIFGIDPIFPELLEAEDDNQIELTNNFDSRSHAAQHYLKALHHTADIPTDLMPRDGALMKLARRFYDGLSDDDQAVIDSFSDLYLWDNTNKAERNRRFNELVSRFMEWIH